VKAVTNARPASRKGGVARPPRSNGLHEALAERAVQYTVAVNPLVGVRRKDMLVAATALVASLARQPRAVSTQFAKLLRECALIAAGHSDLTAAPGDRRFADPAWTRNAVFRRVLQSYVALGRSVDRCVGEANLDAPSTERARFAMSLLVDAMAPTNFIASNPAALKKLVDTKGASVIRGFANLVEDVASGTGLPRQVDARPFSVGKNLATTPGAVVYRNELVELIQYAPLSRQVYARPLMIVPPQINKFYVFDLAPDKSLVRWALESGVQTFAVSWRNPTRNQSQCGLDAYTEALEGAIDAMSAITGSRDVNVLGACSGGITLTALLGCLAARGMRKVHAATLAVCLLDMSSVRDGTLGLFATPRSIATAKASSRKRGVVEGTDLARMFAWMRPNDLVWNYVVNNYLLGNEPPAHDILYWNSDNTRLPARLHADFLDLFESNAFAHPGKLRVRGKKIDMTKIGVDTYVVGGLNDHITTWQGVYRTARLYGGARATFALSNGGHIQSLINPAGNTRSWFVSGKARALTPERWLERQEKTGGSWWPHWREWIQARSGPLRQAPASVGDERHPALAAAPGTYVLER
jgi:polyhydroxyalkanoate synthase